MRLGHREEHPLGTREAHAVVVGEVDGGSPLELRGARPRGRACVVVAARGRQIFRDLPLDGGGRLAFGLLRLGLKLRGSARGHAVEGHRGTRRRTHGGRGGCRMRESSDAAAVSAGSPTPDALPSPAEAPARLSLGWGSGEAVSYGHLAGGERLLPNRGEAGLATVRCRRDSQFSRRGGCDRVFGLAHRIAAASQQDHPSDHRASLRHRPPNDARGARLHGVKLQRRA